MKITANNQTTRRLQRVAAFRIVDLGSLAYTKIVQGGQSDIAVVDDRNEFELTGDSFVNEYKVYPLVFGGTGPVAYSYESLNPSVATVDQSGYVSYVSEGTATIRLTAGSLTKDISLEFELADTTTTTVFVSFLEGSLAKHISDTIDSRLVGKSASTALRLFTSQDHTAGTYVRNPDVWCADLPEVITCLSPWNSTGGNTRAGTLISPCHIVFAAHYQISTGATVRFVTEDNQVVSRTMTAKLTHPDYPNYPLPYPDITIGLLDSDVPETISFAKVLPDDFNSYLPTLNSYYDGRLPTLTLDQEEKALITSWNRELSDTKFIPPQISKRAEFYEQKIGGDSGNPAILIVNGEPVILTVWTWGGAGAGTSIREHKSAINTMMTTLGGGYQLTEADFIGFTNFS